MTKNQISFIFNQHGGKEKVLSEMMFEIFFDNPRNYMPNYSKEQLKDPKIKEKRLEEIVFDDSQELVIIKEDSKIFSQLNEFTPAKTVLYIPYDDIQGIHIMEDVTFRAKQKNLSGE